MKCGHFIPEAKGESSMIKRKIISSFFIILLLSASGCSAKEIKPYQLIVDGVSSGVLGVEHARMFWEEIVQKAAPAEKAEAETNYSFYLMEAPGKERQVFNYRLSAEDLLLIGEEECYRLTPDTLALALELAYPANYLSASAVEYTLPEGTYAVITAKYDDCVLAFLSGSPEIKVKINITQDFHDLGDEVTGDFTQCKKDGDRIEAICSNLYTKDEIKQLPHIVY